MKIKELIDTTLLKLPKSEMPDDKFDIGYQIITSDNPCQSTDRNTIISYAIKDKLEEVHCQQILNLIELYKDMQCFVRVMPEMCEMDDPVTFTRKFSLYTRLQFKRIEKYSILDFDIHYDSVNHKFKYGDFDISLALAVALADFIVFVLTDKGLNFVTNNMKNNIFKIVQEKLKTKKK